MTDTQAIVNALRGPPKGYYIDPPVCPKSRRAWLVIIGDDGSRIVLSRQYRKGSFYIYGFHQLHNVDNLQLLSGRVKAYCMSGTCPCHDLRGQYAFKPTVKPVW